MDVEESFHAGQTRILEMVAADAPLPDILTSIGLLMSIVSQARAFQGSTMTRSGENCCLLYRHDLKALD